MKPTLIIIIFFILITNFSCGVDVIATGAGNYQYRWLCRDNGCQFIVNDDESPSEKVKSVCGECEELALIRANIPGTSKTGKKFLFKCGNTIIPGTNTPVIVIEGCNQINTFDTKDGNNSMAIHCIAKLNLINSNKECNLRGPL